MSKRCIFIGRCIVVATLVLATPNAWASDFDLECDHFRMEFLNDGTLDALYGIDGMAEEEISILPSVFNNAHWENIYPDYVIETIIVSQNSSATTVKYVYHKDCLDQPDKWCKVTMTNHDNFYEFAVDEVVGDCGDIRLFWLLTDGNLAFNGIKTGEVRQLVDSVNPEERWYCGIVSGNPRTQTGFDRFEDPLTGYEYTAVKLCETLPTPTTYVYDQRFAFYVCREDEIAETLSDIQEEFELPPLMETKQRAENNLDYYFLLDLNGATAQDVIDLCRSTGIYSVLLANGVWTNNASHTEPFELWSGSPIDTAAFVEALHDAGIRVGLHAYIHAAAHSVNGFDEYYAYYEDNYPSYVGDVVDTLFRAFTFDGNDLPEISAEDFAARIIELNADWIYLDGAEDAAHGYPASYFYQANRIFSALYSALENEEYSLGIAQSSEGNFFYDSRNGQTDFWDDSPGVGRTVYGIIDQEVALAPYKRIAGVTPDLGWFGREVHIPASPYARDATCAEWEYMAQASLDHNIPMGIRTTYDDFLNDPLHDLIVPLLRETTIQRRHLGDYDNNGFVSFLDRAEIVAALNNALDNPRIDFNLDGYIDQTDLDAFDALFPTLPVHGSGLPSMCIGKCCVEVGPCTVVTEAACEAVCGVYSGDGTDCSVSCAEVEPVLHPCCFEGDCYNDMTRCDCEAECGYWLPEEEDCVEVICFADASHACCINGSCTQLTQCECEMQFGIWDPEEESCVEYLCPFDLYHPCCIAGVCYDMVLEEDCTTEGGTFESGELSCTQVECPLPLHPCCIEGSCVNDLTEIECATESGIWQEEYNACIEWCCCPN